MHRSLYKFIVKAMDPFLWRGRLVGEENLPHVGPAVFVANHLDALGPIGISCSFPLYLHGWVVADMMDRDLAPAWLQWDLAERQLHLKPPFSKWFSVGICKVAVPLFYSLGCIPVYRGDYERMRTTLKMSMDVIRQGGFLLIFPEDNRMPMDPVTRMQPFQRTFARLGESYHAEVGKNLPFYPVAVHPEKVVKVGKPVFYEPLNPIGFERNRLKGLLESTIREMYLGMDGRKGVAGSS